MRKKIMNIEDRKQQLYQIIKSASFGTKPLEQDWIREDIIGNVSWFEKRSHIVTTKISHFLGKINKNYYNT